ncbi:MAG: tRNA lysidine(34) synthetase TilS [Actinobacteria bacterium]|uniref:tRNA(Ile)-lysidine synthetase n=1 Tax=freshwater metagenome TaxID=449393 RepID=A0A6J6UBY4_9ZZZZ|nr:tRNA lysidine(34) synthetase TilS [Actinomycetota bacterium]
MTARLIQLEKHPLVIDLLTKCDFPLAGTKISCAVSGGPDSMALLVLATASGCEVTAIHVDHGLRTDSENEFQIVEKLATELGAQFTSRTIKIEQGTNLEARARTARYEVMPHDVMTGHTADDQAETVLINLLRGAGLSGLSGMQRNQRHPILALRRAQTHQLCRELKIEVVEDPTNTDPKFQRNRIRHELIPLMDAISQRDVAAILDRQADLFREDSMLLDDLAKKIDVTDAKLLAAAPIALARRAIRQWLTEIYPPDAATVERVLDVARGTTLACEIGSNREVRRSQQRLQIFTN